MNAWRIAAACLVVVLSGAPALAAPPAYPLDWGKNYLASNAGTKVRDFSAMENQDFGPQRLIDNNLTGGTGPYCSWKFDQKPAFASFELGEEIIIGRVAFINEQRLDVSYHAKDVVVEVSQNGQVWTRVGKFTLEKKADVQSFTVDKAPAARFVKVIVESNYGDNSYVIMEEMAVFGQEKPRMTKEEYAAFLALIVKSTPSTADIKCSYRFYNVDKFEDLDLIQHTIRYHCKDGTIHTQTTGSDAAGKYVQYEFVIAGVERLVELGKVLPFKKGKVEGKDSVSLLLEEFGPQFSTNYKAASFTGTLRTLVRFKVPPKAMLFYSVQPDKEIRVPDEQIDAGGNVELQIQIPRKQEFLYARLVLGKMERYLRIQVETGEAEEILRETYMKRK